MRLSTLFCFLVFSLQAYGVSVAGDASSSTNDKSCINPAGTMAQACKDLSLALNDSCVKKYYDQFQQKAAGGSLKDGSQWCSNSGSNSDSSRFRSVCLNFFGGIVAHESSGNSNSVNASAPNGSARGYFQMDEKSANGYECCKGITTADFKNDPKKSAICGVGANLQNMVKESCWAMGGGGDANSFGAAKYQQVLRDVSPKDQATKKEILSSTQDACRSPSRVQDFGGSSAVAQLLQQRAPASQIICGN